MTNRPGNRIMDRPEYQSKPKPLTFLPDETVAVAVKEMSERDYGSVVIIDDDRRVIGLVTERDIMKRIVNVERDAKSTKLSEIMTADPRVARETDDLLEWLRIMSNERFRRLPIVDAEGRIESIFTQGDFVSYTWPDLIYQAKEITRATLFKYFNPIIIVASILVFLIALIALLRTL
ncbi:MAG: CBS domain-containing protein [Pseudomonadota bacterium]